MQRGAADGFEMVRQSLGHLSGADSGGFLASVLLREQTKLRQQGRVRVTVDPEQAASMLHFGQEHRRQACSTQMTK